MSTQEKAPFPSQSVSWLSLLSLLTIFCGQRLLDGKIAQFATGLGAVLFSVGLGWRAFRVWKNKEGRRSAEAILLILQIVAAVATGMGVASSLIALWPATLLCAVTATLFVELAYAPTALALKLEGTRIKQALWSGLSLSFLLIFAFSAYYVADARDEKLDLSYFRVAKPGQSTMQIAQALASAVTVTTFFPPANEVAQDVHEYVGSVQKQAPLIHLNRLDVAVDPKTARDLGVSQNGTVVIARGGQKEQLSLGTDLERARSALRTLDSDFQKKLLSISKGKRTVYLTEGHGERTEDKVLRKLLESMNLDVRTLSASDGLANQVPEGAAAVWVIGPKHALLPEEASSLQRYIEGGGRVLYALDPLPALDVAPLLSPWGLKFSPIPLANDVAYVAMTRRISDRTALATATYSSHPAVTTLSQLGRRAPLVFLEAGSLEASNVPTYVTLDMTVRAHAKTFADVNGNFEFDAPAEMRRDWPLVSAAKIKTPSGKEGRALIVADSDLLSDSILPNEGNTYFALDAAKWLLGDEALAGTVVNEEDKPIAHTQKQNVAWFYSTLFLAPALVLGFGAFWSRRKQR